MSRPVREGAPIVECPRCGTDQSVGAQSYGIVSHDCPHGFVCVAPPRKQDLPRSECPFCLEERAIRKTQRKEQERR